MDKVYMTNDYGRIIPHYRISGTDIDNGNVYYKNDDGDLFSHATYENDSNYMNYEGSFSEYLASRVFDGSDAVVMYDSNGDPLVGSDIYWGDYAYRLNNGELIEIGCNNEVAAKLIADGNFVIYNTAALLGSDIYQQHQNDTTNLPIQNNDGASKLVTRYPARYEALAVFGLDNMSYYEGTDIDYIPRGKITNNVYAENDIYYNWSYFTNAVSSRSSCFEPLLNNLRGDDYSGNSIYGRVETYGPYIINRVGKCVAITHAPDVGMYSKINFGDGTGQKIIFTDPAGSYFDKSLIDECWIGNNLGNNATPTRRPSWSDSYATDQDPYLTRMRDYRAVHRYASNGTYTITIESYAICDAGGSDNGTAITHTTHTFNLTVGDASDQDIIYFKIPQEFDHLYINGVRCPVVEQGDDYNVVGLDVTEYNWLLGKMCAGRRDVVVCALPSISTTNYVKYQCHLQVTQSYFDNDTSNDVVVNSVDQTFDMTFDSKSQLYYVDNLAGKLNIPDFGCRYFNDGNDDVKEYSYSGTATIYGVAQDNSTTEVVNFSYDPCYSKIRSSTNTYGVEISSYYYNWEPYFALSSIQVAEFENDYVRTTKDDLPYVRSSRWTAKFMSDYPSLTSIKQVFGNDAITPLCEHFCSEYYDTYTTSYDPVNGTPGIDAVVILTEACIGKTYDLRNAVPWKAFFPSCYCVDTPLSIYD